MCWFSENEGHSITVNVCFLIAILENTQALNETWTKYLDVGWPLYRIKDTLVVQGRLYLEYRQWAGFVVLLVVVLSVGHCGWSSFFIQILGGLATP